MPRKKCTICDRDAWSRDYCLNHYRRWQKYGDPLKGRLFGASDEERFLARVDKSGATGCWVWTGGRTGDGYGIFWDGTRYPNGNARTVGAHRWSFQHFTGIDASGFEVCHACDVPECVNPQHLFVGTHSANMRDSANKGRQAGVRIGSRNGKAKLTPDQVLDIYANVTTWAECKERASLLGVTPQSVNDIITGKNWSHLTGHSKASSA